MIQESIDDFISNYKFEDNPAQIDKVPIKISQSELMNAIHQEFQRSFIRKLYPHLEWTDRIFWAVTGTIQQKYCKELSLNQITTAIKRYLTEYNLIIPIELSQRDQAKLIRDIICELQQEHEGKAPKDEVFQRASEAGINEDKVEDIIKRLKREGAIFEPRAGHLKST